VDEDDELLDEELLLEKLIVEELLVEGLLIFFGDRILQLNSGSASES
jgi:hypothetical protein